MWHKNNPLKPTYYIAYIELFETYLFMNKGRNMFFEDNCTLWRSPQMCASCQKVDFKMACFPRKFRAPPGSLISPTVHSALLKWADGQPILSWCFVSKTVQFQGKLFTAKFWQAAVAGPILALISWESSESLLLQRPAKYCLLVWRRPQLTPKRFCPTFRQLLSLLFPILGCSCCDGEETRPALK